MNVSGLKIDVENLMAPTSSTWSIPNISITPIPPNPTNTKMHVSEGQGSTPEISSKANPNQNSHVTSSLILFRIESRPRNPLRELDSQPPMFYQDLRFMWATNHRFIRGNQKDPWTMLLGMVCRREIWD
ncbi:hypothetical protein O181_012161 [Austropuccinia psidii MF-1]|uniref:Uncharacterized protein n=1 Tax=Austropuccinia psidii MF-1 TaxID=1389203 RepID=A0A9Q3BX85_9BASI|nr:hypothetical protein [Austropuccinia psidii MF-1]